MFLVHEAHEKGKEKRVGDTSVTLGPHIHRTQPRVSLGGGKERKFLEEVGQPDHQKKEGCYCSPKTTQSASSYSYTFAKKHKRMCVPQASRRPRDAL